jgi:hypothetical protein
MLGIARNTEVTTAFGLAPLLLRGARRIALIHERTGAPLVTTGPAPITAPSTSAPTTSAPSTTGETTSPSTTAATPPTKAVSTTTGKTVPVRTATATVPSDAALATLPSGMWHAVTAKQLLANAGALAGSAVPGVVL